MQIQLSDEFVDDPQAQHAAAIVRQCVHCGFCNATCPTYQLLGDERDGPRGRIYLIKQVLEGQPPSRSTQQHLDRCLTCRSCETTCPSGVQYGQLLELGRHWVDEQVPRPLTEQAARWLLKNGLTSPVFAPALQLGQAMKPVLPATLQKKIPNQVSTTKAWPTSTHARKVLLLAGCVQPALQPNINIATARVLDAVGIQTIIAPQAGCCGALRTHLGDLAGGQEDMRRNIDVWWPWLERGEVEAIVMNASGCGVMVKDYGRSLQHDPVYAAKAERVSAMTRDLIELLAPLLETLQGKMQGKMRAGDKPRLAYHPPCTLQHGQGLRGGVEALLSQLGFTVHVAAQESHLCCGSAGTYSVLQPELATQLRDRKLHHLAPLQADCIVSANVGCIGHLQTGTQVPVRHWVEVVERVLLTSAKW
jgi:glycolate oxidase iron-sulfur subunit